VSTGAADSGPVEASGRAVSRDFFPMFNVPFKSGGPWTPADDEDEANVVIIGTKFAERLFPHDNGVGKTVTLNEHDYRVVGVVDAWNPQPRVYDVSGRDTEDVFLPFSTAIDRQIERAGGIDCSKMPDQPGWFSYLNSECIWFGFWVELPAAAAAQSYRDFLRNYAAEQTRLGRFHWAPRVALYDVRNWLSRQKVVPDEVRLAATVAFGFLFVCLLNSTALLLAKFSGSSGEFSVRRALGASKIDIFAQCFAETAAVGFVGGLLGLILTTVGLRVERSVMDDPLGRLTHLDSSMVLLTLILAIVATIGSGLYPAWRASRVQPAWHLKAQ
jgi:putative ABC transport system permease protein